VHRRIPFTRLKQGRTLFESTIRLEV
jgi:hypothetical protein